MRDEEVDGHKGPRVLQFDSGMTGLFTLWDKFYKVISLDRFRSEEFHKQHSGLLSDVRRHDNEDAALSNAI